MYKNIDFFKKMKEEGKTLQEVSQMCNVSTKTITNWEKRFDIKLSRSNTRKYYFDEEYFLNIDNEEKAYFLGLIMADGYINKESCAAPKPCAAHRITHNAFVFVNFLRTEFALCVCLVYNYLRKHSKTDHHMPQPMFQRSFMQGLCKKLSAGL